MTDFLQQMAVLSEQRAADAKQTFRAADLDTPVSPITLQGFDIIADNFRQGLKENDVTDRRPAAGLQHPGNLLKDLRLVR